MPPMAAAARRHALLHEESAAEAEQKKSQLLRKVLAASGPAILNNVAAPAAAAVQLALLGQARTPSMAVKNVAVWTAVTAVTTFVANVANFVVVVTMARVGHALGAQEWSLLGTTVRAALLTALIVGSLLAATLWLARVPLLAALSLSGDGIDMGEPLDEAHLAAQFLPAAILRVPPLLVLRAASSTLVGYQRVRLASAINTALAVCDTVAVYVCLHVLELELRALGFAVASTCAIAAAMGVLAVFAMPPHPSVRVFACRSVTSSSSSSSLCSLARDSVNVLIRSLLLSGSVLSLTVATSPLGSAALNAHAVVLQLWMVRYTHGALRRCLLSLLSPLTYAACLHAYEFGTADHIPQSTLVYTLMHWGCSPGRLYFPWVYVATRRAPAAHVIHCRWICRRWHYARLKASW